VLIKTILEKPGTANPYEKKLVVPRQGLTLVHSSAQPEPLLSLKPPQAFTSQLNLSHFCLCNLPT